MINNIYFTYMIKKRTNIKLITFSDRTLDMIEEIKQKSGWSKTTDVVIRGIEELYKQTFKYRKK